MSSSVDDRKQVKLIDVKHPELGLFVNNEYLQGSGEKLDLRNPKDRTSLGFVVNVASQADVDKVVENAKAAFRGEWSKWTGEMRGQALYKLAELLDQHKDELGYLESLTSGKPVSSVGQESVMMLKIARYYAGWADKIKGESHPADDGFYKIVKHVPLGVCCGIVAWNASLLFTIWKTFPALATGNVMIVKPSEKSPVAVSALAKLFKEAGFPPGVFQVVLGAGDVGSMLSAHMGINKISFTGSTAVGRKIQEASAKTNLKRVTLELGGKSPAIVFKDADFQQALMWVTAGITVNSGQVCAATSRLFIEASIFDDFLAQLKQIFQGMGQNVGEDPQDPKTQYGPLVDQIQYDKVTKLIQEAKQTSQTLVGGDGDGWGGNFVAPTIFLEPDESSAIYREEIFGPVLCVQKFSTEDEAIDKANNTDYGLSGAIFTRDIARAMRVSDKIESGTVGVNCNLLVGPQAPMGGFKLSGVGRELGEHGLKQFTETKTIWISSQ